MRFSEGRLSYLAHHIVATLKREGLANVENERHVLNRIKEVLDAADREHEARIEPSCGAGSSPFPQCPSRQPRVGRPLPEVLRRGEPQAKNLNPGG